jgi:hypothetical protein
VVSVSPSTRWVVPLSTTAAVLIVLGEVLRLAAGLVTGPGGASSVGHTVTHAVALLAMGVLLLALTALYLRSAPAVGALGLVGYLLAFSGVLLVAGDWWFEAFVVPTLAGRAPELLALPPSGALLAGAVATIALYSAGWVLFGSAVLRTGAPCRLAGVLMVGAGLAGPLVLQAPYQVLLAVAVGWAGHALDRAPGGRTPPSTTGARSWTTHV